MVGRAAANKTNNVRIWLRRSVLEATLLMACALAALVGVVIITIGGYASLSEFYTPWIAGLIVGSVILILSIIGALTVWYATRPPEMIQQHYHSNEPPPQETQIDAVTHIGEHIGASLNNGRIKTTDVIIAALVAGTVLGATPALRQRILQRKRRSTDHPPKT